MGQSYWHAIAVEILSGLLWGGFNLVHLTSLLTQTPKINRTFSAYYQIIVTLSMALAAFGSFDPVIEFVGYPRINYWAPDCGVIFLVLVRNQHLERACPINTLPCQVDQ